jgi:hypothetical protein
MFEEQLLTYGPLGVWTATLLYEKFKTNSELKTIIKNNTEALIKFYEIIKSCHVKKTTKV